MAHGDRAGVSFLKAIWKYVSRVLYFPHTLAQEPHFWDAKETKRQEISTYEMLRAMERAVAKILTA